MTTPNVSSATPTLTDALLLALISMMGPFAANTYIPAFPDMMRTFGVSENVISQSLSVYLLCFAVGSLFVGTLSDTFGRRRIVVAGALGFCVAAIGASLTEHFGALLFWRMVQGFCASVGPVVTQAIVRDRWSGAAATKMLALMTLLFALAPAFAPIFGGFVTVHYGWRAVFWALTLLNALIATLGIFVLQESLPQSMRRALRPIETLRGYGELLRHRAYLFGVVGHGFCFMGGILYTAGGADFVMHILHRGVEDFGYLTLPLIVFSMLGSFLTGRWVGRIGGENVLRLGLFLLVFSGVIGLVLAAVTENSWPLVMVAPCLYQFAMSWSRPVMATMNLDYFPKRRGMAASVQQFFQTLSFAICAALWVPLVWGDVVRYAAVMLLAGVFTWVCWYFVAQERKKAAL